MGRRHRPIFFQQSGKVAVMVAVVLLTTLLHTRWPLRAGVQT